MRVDWLIVEVSDDELAAGEVAAAAVEMHAKMKKF